MKPYIYILLSLFYLSASAQDTTFFNYFNKIYEDSSNISIRGIIPNEEGYLGFGSYLDSLRQLHMRQINEKGETQWIKYLVVDSLYSLFERGANVIENSDGDIVLGYTKYKEDFGQDRDVHFMKINKSGEILLEWADTEPDQKHVRQLIQTQDGGYVYVGGQQDIQGMSSVQGYIAKYDELGNKVWEDFYSMSGGWCDFTTVFESSSGHLFVGGFGENIIEEIDRVTVKYSPEGALVKDRIDDYDEDDCGYRALYDEANEEFFALSCQVNTLEDYYYLARLDTNLNMVWDSIYEPSVFSGAYAAGSKGVLKSDGGFVSLMWHYKENNWDQPVIADFSATGEINWIKSYKTVSGKHIYAHDLRKIDGGYVVSGYEHHPAPQRGWVFTIDSLGNTCSSLGCDSSIVVSIDTMMVGLWERETPNFKLYPNPAKESINLLVPPEYVGKPIILEVYDVYGREALTQNLSHTLQIDIKTLFSGAYTYRLRQKELILKRGMFVVK